MPGNPKPLISVITPAYNHSAYVQDTVKSIINQDYPNLEYIIIDDGSPDDTAEKIAEMSAEANKRFSRFVFEKQKNQGIIRTLNNALKHAKGDFVFFLASDDLADKNAVTTLYDFLSQHPDYALAVPDNRLIDTEGKVCFWNADRRNVYDAQKATYKTFGNFLQSKRRDFDFDSNDFGTYRTLIRGNYFPGGPLIKRSVLEQVGYFSEKAPLEDYYLMMQVAKLSKLKYVNKPLLSYRWHDHNTVKNSTRMFKYSFQTTMFEKEYCQTHGFMWEWYKKQCRYLIELLARSESKSEYLTMSNCKILVMGVIPLAFEVFSKVVRKIIG